jgi:hypothetical protein
LDCHVGWPNEIRVLGEHGRLFGRHDEIPFVAVFARSYDFPTHSLAAAAEDAAADKRQAADH